MNHLDEDAELYALGLIGPERELEIEAHIATCEACRARVVAAESAAAALSSTLAAAPPAAAAVTPRRRNWAAGLAAAAAVVLAATTAFEGSAARSASTRLAATDTALLAMAGSHFLHVSLTTPPGTVAKAIYARDGAWYYVVVSNAPPDAHVIVAGPEGKRDLGALLPGKPATLFARGLGRVAEIDVAAGGATIARGKPSY